MMITLSPLTTSAQDVAGAIACVRAVFQENYFFTSFYEPEFWRTFPTSGRGLFLAARDAEGKICGLGAYTFADWYPDGAFIYGLMVVPQFRHQGIATRLCAALMADLTQRKITYVATYPVLFHRFSQQLVLRFGFTPCGVLNNAYPSSAAPEYAAGFARLPVGLAVRIAKNRGTSTIYVPNVLTTKVTMLVRTMGINIEVEAVTTSPRASGARETQLMLELHGSFAQLILRMVGTEVATRLVAVWANPAFADVTFCEAYVAVNTPSGVQAVSLLLAQGFQVAGFLPSADGMDYLVFTYTTLPVAEKTFTLTPSFAQLKTLLIP